MKKIGIIGGGVCGIVSAYFLKKDHPDYEICILEKGKECLKRIKVSRKFNSLGLDKEK